MKSSSSEFSSKLIPSSLYCHHLIHYSQKFSNSILDKVIVSHNIKFSHITIHTFYIFLKTQQIRSKSSKIFHSVRHFYVVLGFWLSLCEKITENSQVETEKLIKFLEWRSRGYFTLQCCTPLNYSSYESLFSIHTLSVVRTTMARNGKQANKNSKRTRLTQRATVIVIEETETALACQKDKVELLLLRDSRKEKL